jgi:hypothetical protein
MVGRSVMRAVGGREPREIGWVTYVLIYTWKLTRRSKYPPRGSCTMILSATNRAVRTRSIFSQAITPTVSLHHRTLF